MNRLIPAVALVLALAIFFGYVSPTYSGSVVKTKATIEREQAALDAASLFAKKQNELASAKNAISPDNLAHLETLLPGSVDNVGLILDLTALAARSGVLLSNINVTPPASAAIASDAGTELSPIGSVDLTLTAAGSYGAFRSFLASIERSARLLDVSNLSLAGSETGVYTYSMTVRLYWLR
ncbi:MAG: hypothetical protein Q7R54_01270 [bacterium]|nr:hypothetical protein [bacterium]